MFGIERRYNMFKDITIFGGNEKIEYSYVLEDGLLHFFIRNIDKEQYKSLKIIYDENIYQISFGEKIKYEIVKAGEIFISLEDNTISFNVNVNFKFFIKTVYKFINKFIDKDTLIQEIELFLKTNIEQKYKKKLMELLSAIQNEGISLEELILEDNDEFDRITNLLLNNELFITLSEQMNDKDLMLLITYYIAAPMIPKIDQETFDNLVNEAMNYDHALENLWRLGMNYDGKDYNYDLLDTFFVNSKDSWYLAEYISGVTQVNQKKIVDMIIKTRDKAFINKLLMDNFIQSHLEEKYKDELAKSLNVDEK